MSTTWVILVGGYGSYLFTGSAAEAEGARVAKARWEKAPALKRLADANDIAPNKPSKCWNHPGFNNKSVHTCGCPDVACMAEAWDRLHGDEEGGGP